MKGSTMATLGIGGIAAVGLVAYAVFGGPAATAQAVGAGTPIAPVTPVAAPVAATAAPATPVPAVSPIMAAANPLAVQSFDRVLGRADAPVTVIEYASMTCSHCANQHQKTLPQLKKEWLDTGKAKFIYRDLPWDNLALGMAKLARCAPEAQYYPLVQALFDAQPKIVRSGDPLAEIKSVAAMAGFDGQAVDACIRRADLHALVEGMRDTARNVLGVTGTPATFIDGQKIEGFADYKDLKPMLEAAYVKATGPATGGVRR
jgi:protein-disulfide isomerase